MESNLSLGSKTWPDTSGPEYEAAARMVLREGPLTEGPETHYLEREFARALTPENHEVPFVVATNGGTQAIETILWATGANAHAEVVVPSLTFSGTALPVLRTGAKLVFADVDPITYCVTPETLARAVSPSTTHIIVVHLHGYVADVRAIRRAYPGIVVIEDACQAYGAYRDGVAAGMLAERAAFSLNKTKTVFGGEGGLAVFRYLEDSNVARSIRRFGETYYLGGRDDVSAERGAYQMKITEMAAAIARVSLRELPERVKQANHVASVLTRACDESGFLRAPVVEECVAHAWHKFRVRVEKPHDPFAIMSALNMMDVPVCRWQSKALPDHPVFRRAPGAAAVAREVLLRTFILGSEARPLCSVTADEAEQWADKIINLKGKL